MADDSPATTPSGLTPTPQSTTRHSFWSNLNLNGPVPARVRPAIGEWGPTELPSTKQKKRLRWLVPIFFVLAVIAVVLAGWYFWMLFR